MKKTIIFVCLFIGVLLLLTPVIPAVKLITLGKENTMSLFDTMKSHYREIQRERLNAGFGLLELFIAFLMFLYIELGIIFNRSFTLILLFANLLYEIGLQLGLIEPTISR